MSQNEKGSHYTSWSKIIQSVQTPLGFFVLPILVSSVVLSILAYRASPPERNWLILLIFALNLIVIVLVVVLAIFRPEALQGLRPGITEAVQDKLKADKKKVQQIADEASIKPDLIDPKLVSFIPPLNPTQFKIVRFPDEYRPKYFDYKFVPTGYIILYQIPFFLLPVIDSQGSHVGHAVIDLQPSILNEPASKKLNIYVDGVKYIHLLISAGHGWRLHEGVQFLYKRIGYLRIIFKDNSDQRVDIKLGEHVREWAFGNSTNLVTELDISKSKPAWLSHDNTKRFDLLTVQIENQPRDISSLEIVAEFEEGPIDKSIKTPAIIVSAITLERSIP